MDDLEFQRKELIRQIVDNPLFDDIFKNMKTELANSMLETTKEEERDSLYHTAAALTKLQGELVKIANDVRMIRNGG